MSFHVFLAVVKVMNLSEYSYLPHAYDLFTVLTLRTAACGKLDAEITIHLPIPTSGGLYAMIFFVIFLASIFHAGPLTAHKKVEVAGSSAFFFLHSVTRSLR